MAPDHTALDDAGAPPPIRLRDMGSFHVGGHDVRLSGLACREVVMAEGGQPVSLDPNGTYRVEQMYAQYFLAEPASGRPPLAFWHGGGMTGAAWETTPDGREGWLNAFLRRGWDAYLCDAVERGRAGYALVPEIWPEAPIVQTREDCYTRFRIGRPGTRPGSDSAYPNTQFPVAAFDRLAAQMVPRWVHTDAAILQGYLALLERVGRMIVICHSQAGVFGIRAAQARPDRVRAVVALEPASIPLLAPDADYRTPTLIVMGDNMDTDPRWPRMRARVQDFARRYPCVTVLSLPEVGITGNSHMLMMDRNSLDLAGRVHDWLMDLPPG
ncbi:hypothetical protein [Achromobacter marplatensis]|jgi:pimeloyl-ACP methyl ester carboxylesterase|uniref:AB hydrolase-1 domain-containing protein n=1 Tax=Achromobacter marplatensis TaxID=470868 RepID=A0AA43B1A8_9BURK|nr:hypothetical protein [Achromobacter marplatensis]MDH2050614.1 hypothetical protein [Achromobacter marplatensis]